MYLLVAYQGDERTDLALFSSEKDGQDCLKQLPAYVQEEVDGFLYEYLKVDQLPFYTEIEWRGQKLPISRYMFPLDTDIDLFWKEIPFFSQEGEGILDGVSRIDAYSVENSQLKEHLEKREAFYDQRKKELEYQGFEVSRAFLGSEDGEAVLYRKHAGEEWMIDSHLDLYELYE